MVVLYTPDGDFFSFSNPSWDELLENAMSYGWKPEGTVAPPREFNLTHASEINAWDGNYSWPKGQTVGANDSEALGAAVERALGNGAKWKFNAEQHLRLFRAFCLQRGFLISQRFPDVYSWKLAS